MVAILAVKGMDFAPLKVDHAAKDLVAITWFAIPLRAVAPIARPKAACVPVIRNAAITCLAPLL
jgi:hypothetical protein